MSAKEARGFVDANVLVYAYEASAAAKREAAARLLARLWNEGTRHLSVQVLQEFFVNCYPESASTLSVDEAAERVREFSAWRVFSPRADDVLAAIGLHQQARIGFWDAMVVRSRCTNRL
jgi:predicted nucleic acid-binding protein